MTDEQGIQPFFDASRLTDSPALLRASLKENGYVFIPGAIDVELIEQLRSDIAAVLHRHSWLEVGNGLCPSRPATVEGDDDYFDAYQDIQRLESFHSLPHSPAIRTIMQSLLGDRCFPHPLSIARLCFPNAEAFSTPAHQDFPNNQGTVDLCAAWIPLHDCPVERGALQVLAGSNRLGLLPLDPALGAGFVTARTTDAHNGLDWHSGDMKAGDMLVFHSLTVHRAAPNQSDKLRLSVDYRFQPDGDGLTSGCLLPHFGKQSWDDIYAHWDSTELQYYWRNHRYTEEPFDQNLRSSEVSPDLIKARMLFIKSQHDLAMSKGWQPSDELTAEMGQLISIFKKNSADEI